jgi:thiol-disulfide isomerase/thioredoxin
MGVSRSLAAGLVGAVVLGAAGVGALLYVNLVQPAKTSVRGSDHSDLARFATGALEKLEIPAALEPATDYVFLDPKGQDVGFDAFNGQVAVINLWAMWCAPCREEMPTLAGLANAYSDNAEVIVVPINVDLGENLPEARAFLADNAPLTFFNDPKFQLPFEFAGKGAMPQTIILDRQGRIRAHLTGDADWASPEAMALIDALLSEG